jgi:hypothetical protein
MRNFRIAAISVLGTAALLAPAGTAFANTMTTQSPHIASATVLKANTASQKTVKQLIHNTSYTPMIRQYTPKPTSTKGFNGYQQIIVKSPKGTTPVAGYFKLTGAASGSVVVTSARVDLKQNAYVLNLKFPGEQGNPGHLTVTTISR